MAEWTTILRVDGTNYPLAADINAVLKAILRPEFSMTESISATKTLNDDSFQLQFLTASGANRDVRLAPEAITNHPTLIYNTGASNNLVIKDDAGAITYAILAPDEWMLFIPLNAEGWVIGMRSVDKAMIPGGRLTLTSGTPVTTADVTGATNVYYTPYLHNQIQLWDGVRWATISFTETTLALGTVTSDLPYDVFGYLSAGVLTLEKLAWTNTTTRATAVTLQDGRYCKSGDKTRLYLGTFHSTSTTQTEDSDAKRFLWNMYNRADKRLTIASASSHTYTTASWRQWNNATANKVEVIVGLAEMAPMFSHKSVMSGATGGQTGMGFDSLTAASAALDSAVASQQQYSSIVSSQAVFIVGYHYIAALQIGATTVTFSQFNITGYWRC